MWLLRTDMSGLPRLKHAVCPNGCGDLTLLKKRQPMLHLVPEDLLEYVKDAEENDYGSLAGVCPECGFVLILDKEAED